MRTYKSKIAILSFSFLLMLSLSCKKDPPIDPEPTEPVMPPLTHQGLNTFGCYIDGELFVANDGDGYWDIPAVSGSFDEGEGILLLQASRYIDGEFFDDIRIQVLSIESLGEFSFYSEGDELRGYTGTGGNCDYYYDTDDYGVLNVIHLDKVENIIAGTFKINLINKDCATDTLLKITDGRFDFRY